eukprot:1763840-Prymnesium_polylepis.1
MSHAHTGTKSRVVPARGSPSTDDHHHPGRAHAASAARHLGRAAPSTRGAAPNLAASPDPDRSPRA